jgi:hypothetical protein
VGYPNKYKDQRKTVPACRTCNEEFAKIDDFNLDERAKRVPAEKHFWVCRLIDAKIEREKLSNIKNKIRTAVETEVRGKSPVMLNQQISKDVENSDSMSTINQRIKDNNLMIEYLERLVSAVNFIAQDIKNIIDIKRQQEL